MFTRLEFNDTFVLLNLSQISYIDEDGITMADGTIFDLDEDSINRFMEKVFNENTSTRH